MGWLVVTFTFRKDILDWLDDPLDGRPLVTLGPAEPFTTSFNVSLYAALALSLPILIWQVWAFLAPAFTESNQRTVVRLVGVATLLLVCGMAFAYWVVLPNAIDFLLGFDSEVYEEQVQASRYFSFAAAMILTVGVVFELPIFIVGLVRLGVLSATRLRRNRRIGYGACLIAAVLLPGVDFVSMALQALPILALFEISIWSSVLLERRWRRAAAESAAAGEA